MFFCLTTAEKLVHLACLKINEGFSKEEVKEMGKLGAYTEKLTRPLLISLPFCKFCGGGVKLYKSLINPNLQKGLYSAFFKGLGALTKCA